MMKKFRLILRIWLCLVGFAYADSSTLTNASNVTNVLTLTNIVTSTKIVILTNNVTLTNIVTQIAAARQTSGMTIISALIALVVGGIALQQFLLAKEKFRLDLFEKRIDLYRAVELFLNKAAITRDVTNEDFIDFNKNTQTLPFVFGEDITAFVYQIRTKASDARVLKNDFEKMPQGNERHLKYKEYEAIQLELYDANRILALKFEPYLKFHNWKYGLIWPKKKKPIGLIFVDAKPPKQ